MKKISLFAGLLLFANSPAFADKEVETSAEKAEEAESEPKIKPSILTFADQTRMTGTAKSIEGTKQLLTLESPSLDGEAFLKTDQLLEMTLGGTPKKLESDHYAIATIKKHYNQRFHDSIRGRLVHLDNNQVTLDTWYAGRLTLRRSLVQSLDIYNQPPVFYEGPDGPDGWVSSNGGVGKNWTFKDRTMISKNRNGIAREVTIPEKAKITFTADWKNSPYFRILLFSESGKRSYPNSGYSMNVQRSYLAVYRHTQNARNNSIISESIRNLLNAETAKFTIYLDRSKEGNCAIYIDDTEIGSWKNVDDSKLAGKWLHFVPQNESPVRFSKISIAQWDGVLPTKQNEKAAPAKPAADAPQPVGQEIRLANGDVVIGSVEGIDKGLASLTTSFGEVSIPVRVMRSVDLVTKEDQVKMQTNDIRAWFHEGGHITINLKSFDGKTLKGSSQAWGYAEFDINAFSRIDFNIWEQDLASARNATNSDW